LLRFVCKLTALYALGWINGLGEINGYGQDGKAAIAFGGWLLGQG
jgi:hypothetical protein